jgi:aminoglycoside phosphotransferase (APT) family kinase protein
MPARGATPVQRCINWYWQTWEWIQDRQFARLMPVHRWLLDNAPVGGETLTHGDSTLHNYLFVGNKLTGVLDWEMSCISRPEFDIALQTVGNELFAAPPGSGFTQPPSQDEWLERYARAGGRPLEAIDYYRRASAYMILIVLLSLQRSMTEEVRASQRAFIERVWGVAEH